MNEPWLHQDDSQYRSSGADAIADKHGCHHMSARAIRGALLEMMSACEPAALFFTSRRAFTTARRPGSVRVDELALAVESADVGRALKLTAPWQPSPGRATGSLLAPPVLLRTPEEGLTVP